MALRSHKERKPWLTNVKSREYTSSFAMKLKSTYPSASHKLCLELRATAWVCLGEPCRERQKLKHHTSALLGCATSQGICFFLTDEFSAWLPWDPDESHTLADQLCLMGHVSHTSPTCGLEPFVAEAIEVRSEGRPPVRVYTGWQRCIAPDRSMLVDPAQDAEAVLEDPAGRQPSQSHDPAW